ncbi:hypothetical protein E6P09_14055 [Haloferax mediterranei ATCC 33500]|uniref:Uncharacterized protein n=2 Tax=Haloferax mediterranei (strain ATCC 33500 / DSM 1411 / JCM 8866 / NBRC 14739 / NCIMB 2177 / R-4) TaxID=523841 RepID=M0IQG2_HALMT|nr:hypothetical protein BM92_13530 [Haloferax mediterranei ATCC 33500]ELZ99081.1 hypothetical protein C439_14519 [Haloferax mediterranei ATCC 33500]QCQ76339.1 hypothetical protein E6P09_14055 [Haloferax mediterranei ATCC 33500]
MAMSTQILAASVLSGVNIVFLSALAAVWVRNYRTFRTSLVLGLLAFAVVMLVENAFALYFFFTMQSLYSGDPHVQQAVLVLRGLQLVAVAFLTYVTVR